MTKETVQETVGVKDEEALQRAAIEDLYQKKKQEKQNFEKDTDKEQSDNHISSFVQILSILYNPRKFGGEVTGLDAKPSIPDNIDDVVDITVDDIERIRFEIDGEYNTDWYSWDSDNLDNMIEYYADGDISKFISDARLSYNEVNNNAYIKVPEDINSRTSRIIEKLCERRRLIDNMGYNTFESYSKFNIISYVSFYSLVTLGLITSVSINANVITNICMIILILFIHLMIGSHLSLRDRTYRADEHFKPLYRPIIRFIKFIYNKIDTID